MSAITAEQIAEFGFQLLANKRSAATVEKYTRDIRAFSEWLGERDLSSETLNSYKTYLTEIRTTDGVNSALSTLNTYFEFAGIDIRLKRLKVDSRVLPPKKKELTRAEYERLLSIADSVDDEKGKHTAVHLRQSAIKTTEVI